jgi:hypothetical protein
MYINTHKHTNIHTYIYMYVHNDTFVYIYVLYTHLVINYSFFGEEKD